MSRLYYEPQAMPAAARATITTLAASVPSTGAAPVPSKTDPKQVAEKIGKLIPAEIVAGYSTLIGFATAAPQGWQQNACFFLAFVACLIVTPLYLWSMSDKDKPKIAHIVVSTLAFPFWAYLTTGSTIIPHYYNAVVAGFAVTLYSTVTAWIPLDR